MAITESDIVQFKRDYLQKLQNYTAMVDADDLDFFLDFLENLKKRSEAITAGFDASTQDLYEETWKPVLAQVSILIPSLIAHMERLKEKTHNQMNALGKGQQGLRGYRQALPIQNTFFESEG